MKIICAECSQEARNNAAVFAPCACGGLMQVEHDYAGYDVEELKHRFDERLRDRMSPYASGVWRYKELIAPELEDTSIVTKYEGNTPLYDANEPLLQYAGIKHLQFKAQSQNPSGSFKDNGMTAAVSHGHSLGYRHFACSSTGNTSASLAMYAGWIGAEAHVYVPGNDIAMNKVLQTLAYGAHVYPFEGTYDDGILYLEREADSLGYYVCNSINPLRIEGQKSIIYEIAHQLAWKLPDWIIVPGGALSNATALGKGLMDLYSLGFIHHLPRIAIIQAEGASPFHKFMHDQGNPHGTLQPEEHPYTIASALNIGNPPSWRKAMRYIQQCNGITASVSDEEIMNAKAIIDASGIGCEPASAATLAGLRQLVENQWIHPEERAVCVLTGHMLKDTHAIESYHLSSTCKNPFANPLQPIHLSI
ncbi:threonine synthase [Paenibacillus selenitireducens]|uniref:Threonine synthase n=1 Tax=Paenibacillus selenitireducens TaxID=1324314 RepID=A0A1T2XCY8_9BACL|nr:threonine synthase [Paenibacillus selenitireducens]OPA77688.1 threonine synthase [Paenibacillus selenitireducens]